MTTVALEIGSPAPDQDLALVALARGSAAEKRGAFQKLYERHKDEVFGFLVRLVRDRALAEDVLQEGFVRVYAALDRYDPRRPFRAWLFTIVRNAALDAMRKARRRDETGPAAERAVESTALGEASRQEQVQAARRALARLPDESRALLVQRHALGMKLEELAESLACTERTVRNRLNAAADEFAQALLEGGAA